MGKTELEFFDTGTVAWAPVTGSPGVAERVLSRDPDRGLITRMVRWDAGLDTSSAASEGCVMLEIQYTAS